MVLVAIVVVGVQLVVEGVDAIQEIWLGIGPGLPPGNFATSGISAFSSVGI